MQKKVFIFDMDGVIFDTMPAATEIFLANHPGVTIEQYRGLHTGNVREEALKYKHLRVEWPKEVAEQRYAAYLAAKLKAAVFPGMLDLLQELHGQGYTLVLNTNAYERNTLPLLEQADITHLFDFIAPAEVSTSKVEKFKMIEEKYAVRSEEMLFVTDALGDVCEAEQAEVPTIAVAWGIHDESYFRREAHKNLVAIVHSVPELKSFLIA